MTKGFLTIAAVLALVLLFAAARVSLTITGAAVIAQSSGKSALAKISNAAADERQINNKTE